jgi:hypothetical protein
MAINFPDSPTAGDTFTASDKTWVYVDGKWALKPAEIPLSITVTSAASGDILKWNGSAWVNDSALLAAKANLASPTFTGTPTLPTGTIATTQSAQSNTTAVATTAFVTTAITNITPSTTVLDGGTPETLQFYVLGAVDAGILV